MLESLSELTKNELARLILRQLWNIHDAGGVSMGRSTRSVLLEAAIHLMPMPDMRDLDLFKLDDLYREAGQRITFMAEQLSFPLLQMIPNRELATLLLWYLWLWYANDAQKNPEEALVSEQVILEAALRLLPSPHHHFKEEDLVDEAQERYHEYLQRNINEGHYVFWA